MKPFVKFRNMDASFWAFVKFISENLKYTNIAENCVKNYSEDDIIGVCKKHEINAAPDIIKAAAEYSTMRAGLLNTISNEFMTADEASEKFRHWEKIHQADHFHCKIPMNKQKGDKKKVAYFTAIVNIVAEKTIRELTGNNDSLGFDDDPSGLTYVLDDQRRILSTSSRRFDGAYPSIESPKLVWEIKEYYYATTFGSRVADGVYETQLDGYEFKDLFDRNGTKVYHVLFIDSKRTWWSQGKSYLCRLVDAMNMGIVDEVIVGKEVFECWPALLRSII